MRELSIDELDIFLDMMHHTSQRCEFAEREPEFYRNQMIAYGEDAKLLLAYLDLNDFRRKLDLEKQELEKDIEILAKLEELPNSKKFIKKKKVVDEALALNKRNIRMRIPWSRSMEPVYRWLRRFLFSRKMSLSTFTAPHMIPLRNIMRRMQFSGICCSML